MSDQPEALRLAEHLELYATFGRGDRSHEVARLLREQHAEIERLRGALKGIETLKVTIGGSPASAYQTEGWMRELAREALEEMKPLDADIAAIVHKNLDSLYVEDPPAIDAAMGGKP